MQPKEFVSKTISLKDGQLEVTRTRTSEGYVSITIRQIPASPSPAAFKEQITFDGETYEQDADKAIQLLQAMVDNPCALSK